MVASAWSREAASPTLIILWRLWLCGDVQVHNSSITIYCMADEHPESD
jgi:hypothetical protein